MLETGELDFQGLRDATIRAVSSSDLSQSDIARSLNVHRSAVSRATKEAGPALSGLQCRIIERLTSHEVDRKVVFCIRGKDN
jgi:predicted DNA-binding protein YlxM (UPF0122 family)